MSESPEPTTPAPAAPAESSAAVADAAPEQVGAAVDNLQDVEIRDRLAQMERKPPLYRAFRVTLYTLYIGVAAWLVLSIAISAWQSVYGAAGESLRAQQQTQRPVVAAPQGAP